jgi:hypothetical protein
MRAILWIAFFSFCLLFFFFLLGVRHLKGKFFAQLIDIVVVVLDVVA